MKRPGMILAGVVLAIGLAGCGGGGSPHAQVGTASSVVSNTTNTTLDPEHPKESMFRTTVGPSNPGVVLMTDDQIDALGNSLCEIAADSASPADFNQRISEAGSGSTLSPEQLGAVSGASLSLFCPDESARLIR